MSQLFDVASTAELPVGKMKSFVVGGRTIALVHSEDGFFATDNTCPHRGGPLAEGDLLGNEIVCPWHLWGFDAPTGVCTGNAEVRVATHEVCIEGDRVMVRL